MRALFYLIGKLLLFAFLYCCDFMVNLANRTGTSYDEANTWVLLLLIPGLLAGLVQALQLRALRRGARRG